MGAASKDKTLTDDERAKSIKAFEALGLATQLAEAAASLGWKQPSPIQQQAIPPLLEGACGGFWGSSGRRRARAGCSRPRRPCAAFFCCVAMRVRRRLVAVVVALARARAA